MSLDTFPRSSADFVEFPRWRLTLEQRRAGWQIVIRSFTPTSQQFRVWGERGDDDRYFPTREGALRHVAWAILLWDTERAATVPLTEIEAALRDGVIL